MDPWGLFRWEIGGTAGSTTIKWSSDRPTDTQFEMLIDFEIGGGVSFCFDLPVANECDKEEPLPFNLNVGAGRWLGASTDSKEACIKLGLSIGLTPIDLSGPVGNLPR